MNSTSRESCLFRQLQNDPEAMPESMLTALDVLSGMKEEPTTAEETAEAMAALAAPVCSLEDCKVSVEGLLRYVIGAGAAAPRQALDEVVAPSCELLDIPHQVDAELGSFGGNWPDTPQKYS
jgi:hypothetical protein